MSTDRSKLTQSALGPFFSQSNSSKDSQRERMSIQLKTENDSGPSLEHVALWYFVKLQLQSFVLKRLC